MAGRQTFTVDYIPHGDETLQRFVIDNLVDYNAGQTGFTDYVPSNWYLRTREGEVRGGLIGMIWGGWLHVRILWVAEQLRRGGHGARLLRATEIHARQRGCVGVYLDTYSFQARPFYEKLGYRVYGTLQDHPVGHAQHFLAKRFDTKPAPLRRGTRGKRRQVGR